MGKRHDYTKQNLTAQTSINPSPIKLLLPTAENYAGATIDALIFLALEINTNIRTETEIAHHISKITGGKQCFKQSYISKRIKKMNAGGIVARDKLWTIEKYDGKYGLFTPAEAEKIEQNNILQRIPFDRSCCFMNDPIRGTIFGFKLIAVDNNCKEYLVDIEKLFNKITYNNIFQTILQESTVYILLDTSSTLYIDSVKNLNRFLQDEFLIKKK